MRSRNGAGPESGSDRIEAQKEVSTGECEQPFKPTSDKSQAPRRDWARLTCLDCGVNVVEIGEYYMISSAIWEKKLHLKWSDNLCIGCLESRLGRKLRGFTCEPGIIGFGDFISSPENPGGFEGSDLYNRRFFGEQAFAISKLKRGEPLPRGWKWKKDRRAGWGATNGQMFIGIAPSMAVETI